MKQFIPILFMHFVLILDSKIQRTFQYLITMQEEHKDEEKYLYKYVSLFGVMQNTEKTCFSSQMSI